MTRVLATSALRAATAGVWLCLAPGCASSDAPPPPPQEAPEPPQAPQATGPDVIVLTLDTTRADRIGAYGHAAARTPQLDALAARGVRFSRAYAPVPLTIPSHSTLFTGLLPPRHGVRDNGDHRLSDDAHTLAERLAEQGWRTHAAVGAFVTQAHWGFGQGFAHYDDDLGVAEDALNWRAERRAASVVDDAIAALDAARHDPRPLFLWVHLFDAHAPYEAPAAFAEGAAPYDAELAYMDSELARLFARLDGDEVVVVVGDHGEALGDGGEAQHGLLLSDPTLHVPLVITAPGLEPAVVDAPVGAADVMPTVLALAGLPVPTDIDGHDLFGPPGTAPGVYSETLYGTHHFGWAPLVAVTTPTGRLVRGARDEVEGEVGPDASAWLDATLAQEPAWSAAPATMDLETLEALQALGYVGGSVDAVVGPDAVDPRDGIVAVRRFHELGSLPPSEQIAALEALLTEFPRMRDAQLRLGTMWARAGRMDQAVAALMAAEGIQPDSTSAQVLGDLWLQAGVPDEAMSWFSEALDRDPRSVDAVAGHIEALAQSGRLDEAEAAAAEAIAAHPDHARVVLAGAMISAQRGQPDAAWRAAVSQLAERRPQLPFVHETAAAHHALAGDDAAAEAAYTLALRLRPGSVPTRLAYHGLLRSQGREVEAVKVLRPLVALHPDDPRWHALTAQSYLAMDRPDLAAPHLAVCAGMPGCPGQDGR